MGFRNGNFVLVLVLVANGFEDENEDEAVGELRTTESFHPRVWIGHSERALANFAAVIPQTQKEKLCHHSPEN